MITQILTGAGIGIFAGYSVAMCGGILALLTLCIGVTAGYLLNLRLKEYKTASLFAVLVLFLCRIALFIYPVPEAVPLVCGFICGMAFRFTAPSGAALKGAMFAGVLSYAAALLFVTGSGEASLAFICGGISLLAEYFKDKSTNKFAVPVLLVLLLGIFPAGSLSKSERMVHVDLAMKLQQGACGAMLMPDKAVADKALSVGFFADETAKTLKNFPGLIKVDTVGHYMQLYPVFAGFDKSELYPVVFVNGNGRMCRLASRLVAPNGVLIVPEACVGDVPQAFRNWCELPSAQGFVALSRDFVIDCSDAAVSAKMEQHIKRLGLQETIKPGVCDALFTFITRHSSGVRAEKHCKQINYTLWFFGLVAGAYLVLRLLIFSRFDKGERRWTAIENTFSTVLLLLLLKRFPDTLCTALLPAAVFFAIPAFGITGKKGRLLQLAGAALCVLSIFIPELLNAAQLTAAICCGTMWKQLRCEKDAVMAWVDACSLTGILLGTAAFAVLTTVSAPVIFVIGVTLLLRSNILFRSL